MALRASSLALAFGSADDRAQSADSCWAAASCSLHPSRNVVALALSQRLAILPTESTELDFQSALPLDACTFPEQVTTLCWAGYAGPTPLSYRVSANQPHGDLPHLQDCSLLLGTSSGYLQLHAEDGQLLHRQRIHTSQAQSIQARNSGMGLKPDDGSEDITITFRDAIVRLSSLSVRSVVRQQQQSRRWGEASTPSAISYNIWDLRKAGPRSAGICAGLKPPSLYGSLTGRDTNQKLLLVTSGREPALAAYEAEEVLQRGSLAFVSSLASSVANGVLGVAKAAAWGRQAGYRAGVRNWVAAKVSLDQDGSPRGTKDEDLPKGEPVTLFRSLRDGPRAVDQLLLAPRGSVAVASDSFGRVLLIDVVSLTVIRIWKSYRDAEFGWIMCSWPQRASQQSHTTEDQLLQSQSHAGKRRRADAESLHGLQDSSTEPDKPVSLHLVLYAPRRQALELWQMRHGSRVATSQVSSTCKLLQRAVPFGLDPNGVDHTGCDATIRTSQCMILDTTTGHCMDVLAALQQQTHQTA